MTKELKHCMIDLETLDLIPSTKIVSIGAVIFDPRYSKIGDTFYMELDHKAQKDRTSDKGTVEWWKGQPAEVRKSLKGTESLEDALEELAFFLPSDVRVWGNGSIFDIAILEDAYRQLDIEIPWKFWNILDMRTVKAVYEAGRGGFSRACGGTKHNALDDAVHQAKSVCIMWNKIYNP
jgi:hypothetical protein